MGMIMVPLASLRNNVRVVIITHLLTAHRDGRILHTFKLFQSALG